MPDVAVVTLTGFADIFDRFQSYLYRYEPDALRILVTSRNVEIPIPRGRWKFLCGVEPFIYARNANIGIKFAGDSDVLLVNDDVQFQHCGTIQALSDVAYSDPSIGIVSPRVIGGVGNNEQKWNPRVNQLHPVSICQRPYLAFVCVYIKRIVFDTIGLFDESFDGYGAEDEDLSQRAHNADFKLAVANHAVVKHGFGQHQSSASFARTMGSTAASMAAMRQKFREKHALAVK